MRPLRRLRIILDDSNGNINMLLRGFEFFHEAWLEMPILEVYDVSGKIVFAVVAVDVDFFGYACFRCCSPP